MNLQQEVRSATISMDGATYVAVPQPPDLEASPCISLVTILEGVRAVGSTLNLSGEQIQTLINTVTHKPEKHVEDSSWQEWLMATRLLEFSSQTQWRTMNVTIALAFLREASRKDITISPTDLEEVWTLIKGALKCPTLTWTMTQGLDGSYQIPLWCITEDGRTRELIRLDVWPPDSARGDPNFAIHTHQQSAQSWVLAGEAKGHDVDVTPAHENNATHAQYIVSLQGQDTKEISGIDEAHNNTFNLTNTEKLVCVAPKNTHSYTLNMNYVTPETVFHKLEVDPDALYARITFFDSVRGRVNDGLVLGPISQKVPFTQQSSANFNVADMADLIGDVRKWRVIQTTGTQFSLQGEWEDALRSYRTALHICENNEWLNRPRYRYTTQGRIGKMYRMVGRFDKACESLEEVVHNTPKSAVRADMCGELAMIYRHLDRLEDSKRAGEEQYRDALELNLEKFACRAIGNIGMVNFQLYLLNKDETLLSTAIDQLNERVERAKKFGDIVLEAIGYSRLSLCHIAKGEYEEAVQVAQKNYNLTRQQPDATKTGFAKAFFGRALLLVGRKEDALALFNADDGCSPIIALCKEISTEHRDYIVEMISAGADLKLRDKQGYSALECAVYNGDEPTAMILEQGLRAQIAREGGNVEEELAQSQYEAILRKSYRDIFQDRMRPVLLGKNKDSTLQDLRKTYAAALAQNSGYRNTFDGLKYVRYADFLQCGRLPRSSDGLTQESCKGNQSLENPFIIFFSYRWITKNHNAQAPDFSPDDDDRTQYRRMLKAIEQFLDLHREVDREQLCIWLVSVSLSLVTRNNLTKQVTRTLLAWTRINPDQVLPPSP